MNLAHEIGVPITEVVSFEKYQEEPSIKLRTKHSLWGMLLFLVAFLELECTLSTVIRDVHHFTKSAAIIEKFLDITAK